MGKMVYNTIESKLERKRTMSEPLVNVTRGPIVESVHYGDIAVVDHTGRLLAILTVLPTFAVPPSLFRP